MIRFYNKLINNGVQPFKTSWENELAKKVNLATMVSILYMLIATVFVYFMRYDAFFFECLFATILLFGAFLFNRKNVLTAIYYYYILDFLFLIPVNLKMGIDSYVIVYFFPLIFTLIQLLGKKETIKHLVILSLLCLISVIFILFGFKLHWLRIDNSTSSFALVVFNIILSMTSSTLFALLISFDSIKQQTIIKKILHEKEILLSEVLHRVKNNMNIITSLLNLKKMTAKENETKLALDDCKNRVYSMALVHENIYSSESNVGLNFKEYIENLVREIAYSFGGEVMYEIQFDLEDLQLDLNTSIPCGLIINELITNSFKYGRSNDKPLIIQIELKQRDEHMYLRIKDNGPGISEELLISAKSFGLELIQGLSEQINGEMKITSEDGFQYELSFN
jgi:two-component sensor histidine kinase